MLNVFARSKKRRDAAERLYAAAVRRAREPVFFERLGVPDTLDGRFDLLVLHVWLILTKLQNETVLAQALIDRTFAGFDAALRELGVGDIGLARRMGQLADAFYGRLGAYDAAAERLEEVLVRNLYRGNPPSEGLVGLVANYVVGAHARLRPSAAGEVDFGPLPAMEES